MTVFPDVFTEIAVLMLGQSAGRMDFAAFRQALPPGDVLVTIQHGLALARHSSHRFAARGLMRWTEISRALVRRLWMGVLRMPVGQWQSALNRWPAALMFVLLLGLLVAWMAGM